MALSVDLKVYTPPSVVQRPSTRPQQNAVGTSTDSTRNAAQSFIDSLPLDIQERVTRPNRDRQKQNDFDQAEKAKDEAVRIEPDQPSTQKATQYQNSAPTAQLFTAPISVNSANLLQVQLQASATTRDTPLNALHYSRSHSAYLSAGAQPGGEASARQAALAREEQANRILVVPPVITTINLNA
ncbi:MAG: hypothetical protein HWE34_06405 [Methylocystaceae bacterium]|nr:hypothetical protein [Methylocystaceae bacterium]